MTIQRELSLRSSLYGLLLALVLITGVIALLLATRQGISLGADSFGYVTAARNR